MNEGILDSRVLREHMEQALSAYERYHYDRIKFQDFPDFALTPEKPNYARTIVPVHCSGEKVGDLYAIIFMPRDGTGDTSTFKLGQMQIPEEFRHNAKPERVIPRAKTGVAYEGCFPLFSINSRKDIAMFAASLDELTIKGDPPAITPAWVLGQDYLEYLEAVHFGARVNPKVYMTVGSDSKGNRFGDPHAIYYGANAGNVIQVAGFLAIKEKKDIKEKDNPLLGLTSRWAMPLDYS